LNSIAFKVLVGRDKKPNLEASAEGAKEESPGWKSERSELWNPGSMDGEYFEP
jgi:hypothetical protein